MTPENNNQIPNNNLAPADSEPKNLEVPANNGTNNKPSNNLKLNFVKEKVQYLE